MFNRTYIIVTGPTGSGKTALGFALAQAFQNMGQKTVLINGDSMQLYAHLSIVTARPTDEEKAISPRTPYLLDGILRGDARATAGFWMAKAVDAIQHAWEHNAVPIVVGGTGLYLKTLMEGIAPIPEIPHHIQEKVRKMRGLSLSTIIDEISSTFNDAKKYKDPQRLLRAFEVFLTTGQSMKDFFGKEKRPLNVDPLLIVLQPERTRLQQNLDHRFLDMMKNGALEEVKSFMEAELALDHPLYKATGVTPLMRHIKGDLALNDAIHLAQQHTRQYAKRQCTWMKNQFSPSLTLDPFEGSIKDKVASVFDAMRKGTTAKCFV